jgi:uncharacterized membrane protein
MKPTTQRQIYIYTTLIISLLIILPINYIMNWNLEWYYAILLFFLFRLIGSFIYTYFSGVNVSKIEFTKHKDDIQYFSMFFVLGCKKFQTEGEFENSLHINEKELRHIIDRQTNRKMLYPVLIDDQSTDIKYDYHGKKTIVKFKKYE